ncbi:ATP-binding protein [Spiribacter salilacus]|nr:AAA family ATPase [Spiribacter salilacus]
MTTVNLKEARELIRTCGTSNTFIFQGEPGAGKSAMLQTLAEQTALEARYIDCALLDLGDLQMPRVGDAVEFVPNQMFVGNKPLIVMLDEIGKAMRPVQNALLTLLLEHRIGNHPLPAGSIVFGTTNMTTDGLGDMLQAHAKNRVTFLTVRKPDADEWIEWGMANGIDATVLAWVREYPHCLDSYIDDPDGAEDNPYIFNPREQQTAFVSPRSLAHASHIIKQRKHFSDELLIAALSGTIGESAARDMEAFLSVADALPAFKTIVTEPESAKVPKSPIACVILVLSALTRVSAETIDAWMTYLPRLPREVQMMFATQAMRGSNALVFAQSKTFTQWARENSWAV